MEHLLTHITGLDLALGLVLLVVYLWQEPDGQATDRPQRGLDTRAAD